MPFLNMNLESILAFVPAILVALSFHEFAHGRVADYLGDPTPRGQGRLTLNPLAHLDWLGTLLLVVAGFGWAKPVQVNPLYFRGDRRRGMMLVGLAGPVMNLVLAYLSALLLRLVMQFSPALPYVPSLLNYLVLINVVLAVFNLIPLPPLDGSKVLAGLLPPEGARVLYSLETYGPVILILLVVLGVIGMILNPLVNLVLRGILLLAGMGYF